MTFAKSGRELMLHRYCERDLHVSGSVNAGQEPLVEKVPFIFIFWDSFYISAVCHICKFL